MGGLYSGGGGGGIIVGGLRYIYSSKINLTQFEVQAL